MTPDRQERLKEALLRAQELGEPERTAFLTRLRAEHEALAAEVQALLAQRTRGELAGRGLASLLEGEEDVRDAAPVEARRIGPYLLVERIGAGGMGVVYRAVQEEPVRRQVAVKLLRGGLDPSKFLARFQVERRALARADHPGIARILDAGADEDGTPYLVMELVRGIPITEYCRARGLAREGALSLFISVCRALNHAHERGVIHRDLKPSNVLVSEVDGKPVSKIIDFGIAKVLEEDGRPHTLLTGEGQIVGTLGYMSPEQASGRKADVDRRSDVYSLGAMLYELLTGSLPHDLAERSLAEAIEVIRRDAPRPFRLTGIGRRPDSDLETIARKALQIEPARRYEGAGALADDLSRYLRLEPILARRPSAAYRLRMQVRRHRSAYAAGAATFLFLVAFGITMSVLYAGQRREHERALVEGAKAAAVNGFLQDMLASAAPAHMGKDVTILEALDRALPAADRRFRDRPAVLASVQRTIATTYAGLGEYVRCDSLLKACLATERRLPGNHAVESALTRRELAMNYAEMGQLEEAERTARRALADCVSATGPASNETALCLETLGAILAERSAFPEADSLLTRSIGIRSALGQARSPLMADALTTQGHLEWKRGEPARADSLERQALSIYIENFGDLNPRTAGVVGDLATAAGTLGRPREADSLYHRSIDLGEKVYGVDHPLVGMARNNYAGWLMAHGHHDEAEAVMRDGLRIWKSTLGEDHPWTGVGYRTLGMIHHRQGRLREAESDIRRSLGIMDRAWGHENGEVARTWGMLGRVLADLGRDNEAEDDLRRAVRLQISVTGLKGNRTASRMEDLGLFLLEQGRPDSAVTWIRRAMEAAAPGTNEEDLSSMRCALDLALEDRRRARDAEPLLPACEPFRDPSPGVAARWPLLCRLAERHLPR